MKEDLFLGASRVPVSDIPFQRAGCYNSSPSNSTVISFQACLLRRSTDFRCLLSGHSPDILTDQALLPPMKITIPFESQTCSTCHIYGGQIFSREPLSRESPFSIPTTLTTLPTPNPPIPKKNILSPQVPLTSSLDELGIESRTFRMYYFSGRSIC